MDPLIVYHSRFGGTEACARRLAALIGPRAALRPLADLREEELRAARSLVLGASVDKGRLVRPAARFLASHPGLGSERPLGLFLCHGEAEGRALLERCFGPELLARARIAEAVGGSLDLRRVPALLRLVLGAIGVRASYDLVDAAALERVAEAFR